MYYSNFNILGAPTMLWYYIVNIVRDPRKPQYNVMLHSIHINGNQYMPYY